MYFAVIVVIDWHAHAAIFRLLFTQIKIIFCVIIADIHAKCRIHARNARAIKFASLALVPNGLNRK